MSDTAAQRIAIPGRARALLTSCARRLRARVNPRGQAGFTVVEVLVAATISIGVLGSTLTPLAATQHAEISSASWSDQLQLAQAQESWMLREIRQAYAVLATTPNSIDFDVSIAGVQEQVYYQCDVAQPGTSYHECVRLQAAVGAPLPALSTGTVIVTDVSNGSTPVFGFSPDGYNPTYVSVHLEFPASNGSHYGLRHAIVVNDGAFLRNMAATT
jgi:Tfp pilus assembly protein PilE